MVILRRVPDRIYEEGLRQARSGQLTEAAESLALALQLAPSHNSAQVVLGKVYAQQGRYTEAIDTWRQVLARDADNPKALAGIQAAEERLRAARARARRGRVWVGLLAAVGMVAILLGGFGLSQAWQAMLGEESAVPQAHVSPTIWPTATQTMPAPLPATATAVTAPSATPLPPYLTEEPSVTFTLEQVQRALRAGLLAEYSLEAYVVGAGVQIVGTVPSSALKTLAEEQVLGVRGVELVDSTRLQVIPPPVAETVWRALSTDDRASAWDLQVEMAGEAGVVVRGSVPSSESRLHVEAVVRSVPDVRFVDITGVDVDPPLLAAEVEVLLQADADLATAAIEVQQKENDVLLKGSVPEAELKARAEALARAVAGVDLVDSTALLVVPRLEYTVRRGDSLWSIAEELFGDGRRWRDLYEANQDRIQDPARIVAGTRLRIP